MILYEEIMKRWLKPNGTLWVISDTHFNDPNSKELRGDAYPGDEEVVKLINSKVGKKDTLILLGDVGDISFVRKIRAGYKILIMGNHDKGASNYKRREYRIDTFGNIIDNHLFDEVYEGPVMISDKLILSHEPIFPTLPFLYNIHGHVHNPLYKGDEHHLNVCAEAIDYTPINLLKLIKKGLLSNIDSIHRLTIDKAIEKKKRGN